MNRQVSTGDEPYIVVSSDTHAGLQCEEYRPYLDSALHDEFDDYVAERHNCLLYTSPSPRDATLSRMPSSA